MFEKILQQLKTKYANLGLSEEILKVMAETLAKTVEKDEDVENAVNGAEPLMKSYQSVFDKNRTLSKKVEDLEKAKPEVKPEDKPAEKTAGEQEPAWLKALNEKIDKQNELISGFQAEKTQQTNAQKLQAKLTELKVSKSYLDILPQSPTERTFQSDEEIEAFATSLKTKSDAYEQSVANGSLGAVAKPLFGEVAKEGGISSDVQAFIKTNYNNETNTAV